MSRKSYGTRKEREWRDILYKMGALTVMRSAGSGGLYDLVGVYAGCSHWFQVKAGSDRYIKSMINWWMGYSDRLPPYHSNYLVCWRKSKRRWEVYNILGKLENVYDSKGNEISVLDVSKELGYVK